MPDLGNSRWMTMTAGALIAVGGFVLILWGVARFVPVLWRYSDSPWIHAFSVISTMFVVLTLLMGTLRRRSRTSRAER